MKIESYGPTLTDISKQVKTTNTITAGQTGKIQPGAYGSEAIDKTTLSSGTTAANVKTTPSVSATPAGDTTTLSSTPAAAQSLTQSALETATSRAAKVADLKQDVNSAQYKLDAAKIAEALSNGGF